MKETSETSSALTKSTNHSKWHLQIINFQKSSLVGIGLHERGVESHARSLPDINHAKMIRSIGGNVVHPHHRTGGRSVTEGTPPPGPGPATADIEILSVD